MSSTIQVGSVLLEPTASIGGGVYSTRQGRTKHETTGVKSITGSYSIDEESDSIIEKDVIEERDIRKKQVHVFTIGGLPSN